VLKQACFHDLVGRAVVLDAAADAAPAAAAAGRAAPAAAAAKGAAAAASAAALHGDAVCVEGWGGWRPRQEWRARRLEHRHSRPAMARRRKPLVPPPVRSLKVARRVTSAHHAAARALAAATAAGDAAGARGAREALEAGHKAYQEASQLTTTRAGSTARWVFAHLTARGLRPAKGAPKPRVLEVGAVTTRLLACHWLAVDAIDLRASAPGVRAVDFFDLPLSAAFDAVVVSMVLNCVPTPEARGRMLAGVRGHLKKDGIAFIMLPRRCVEAAPAACTWATFEAAMAVVGLAPVHARRASPKVAFWCVGAGGRGGAVERAAAVPTRPPRGGEFGVCVDGL